MPVLVWSLILLFSQPLPDISLEHPAFSFFCVSIWASCIREIPRTFIGGKEIDDKFQRECGLAASLLGLVSSLICLVLSVQKSSNIITSLWGPFPQVVSILGVIGALFLFVLIAIKIQRTEYGRIV
jgi:hypothetical protein